ncbi:alpha/beta-hydrolase, partial [Meredithblackwellia eburnea MCA 4105]
MGAHLSTEVHSKDTKVTLKHGSTITGSIMSDPTTKKQKVKRFLNVPYALPPTGNRRWTKPVRCDDTKRDIDARGWGNICSQPRYALDGKYEPLVPNVKYTEDCLHNNIWTPVGDPPEGGWPVLFWVHGGWLQIGNANHGPRLDPSDLLSSPHGLRCIIVAVSYRLNLFGFLASRHLQHKSSSSLLSDSDSDDKGVVGNYGFHDQRMSLEWVWDNIDAFGGNRDNVTVSGVSAGAYSTMFLLANELNYPRPHPGGHIIKRVVLHSNAIAAQPKTVDECEAQFEELCDMFGVGGEGFTGQQKLDRLRSVEDEELARRVMDLRMHTFRAVTDDVFVHPDTFARICNGHFAEEVKKRGISILIGEVEREEGLYREINHPTSAQDLMVQLYNYYPKNVVDKIVPFYEMPKDDAGVEEVKEAYGLITADGQVYASERLLIRALVNGGVDPQHILRYRIQWLASFMPEYSPPSRGVAHAFDTPLWWLTQRAGMTPRDVDVCRSWLEPYQLFLDGDKVDEAARAWGGAGPDRVRVLTPEGDVVVRGDGEEGGRGQRCEPIVMALG